MEREEFDESQAALVVPLVFVWSSAGLDSVGRLAFTIEANDFLPQADMGPLISKKGLTRRGGGPTGCVFACRVGVPREKSRARACVRVGGGALVVAQTRQAQAPPWKTQMNQHQQQQFL